MVPLRRIRFHRVRVLCGHLYSPPGVHPSNAPLVCHSGPLVHAGLREVACLLGRWWPHFAFPPFLCSGLAGREMTVRW